MKILQLEDNYPPKEGCDHFHPQWIHKDLFGWHPKPSSLLLTWSHSGKWVKVPRYRETPGPDYHTFKVGRIEKYVDKEGVIREAVAYGDEDTKLMVWYRVEKLTKVMSWIIPDVSPWENSRIWNNDYKRGTTF